MQVDAPAPFLKIGDVHNVHEAGVLTFIRPCREFDFSIEQVRALAAIVQDPECSCMDARDMAAEHLTAVRAKLRELKAVERSLVAFVKASDTSCAGGPGPECLVLDGLAKPGAGRGAARAAGRRLKPPLGVGL